MIDEQPRNSENVFRGTSVTFSLKATGEMPLSYQWEFLTGEKPKREYRINGATLTMDKVQKPDEGYYRCIVSDCNEKEITSESATLELAGQYGIYQRYSIHTRRRQFSLIFQSVTRDTQVQNTSWAWLYCYLFYV